MPGVGIEQHIGDLLNSDLHPLDFLAISNFFRGTTNFNSLGLEQKRILDSFHMLDSRLSAEMITKQTTLLNMLHRQKILTDTQLREVQQVGQSFSVMFRDKKYRNGRFDKNFTNDLTDLVQTKQRGLWDFRIDEAYEHYREQNYFSEMSTTESRSMKSAFRVEFEEHLKTGNDYIGQRYREDMGLEQVTDLTHPEIPDERISGWGFNESEELLDVPDLPQHWRGRVPNKNPVLDLTLEDSAMHDIARNTIIFEKAMKQDLFDNPLATDFDLIRQFENIPSNVPDSQLEAWLLKHKTRNLKSYKNNFAIWDDARAEMNDLTKVSDSWSNSTHSSGSGTTVPTEDTSWSAGTSYNERYFRDQQDNISNLSDELRSTHTESELLLQSERSSTVHSELSSDSFAFHEENPFEGLPTIETPVPSSMQSLARSYIESNLDTSIALAADGSVLLNAAGMVKWLTKNASAMGFVVGVQEILNWVIRNSNMTTGSKKWLDVGVASMVVITGIVIQPENPLGWLAGLAIPVLQAVAFFALPHQKRVMNDNPLEIYGRRWGMVRARDENGKMTWYPAFSGSKKEWAIAFAANSTIRLNYGKLSNLIFKTERDGTVKPYFVGPKHQKEFEISTRDWNDKHNGLSKLHGEDWMYGEKKYQRKYDPLRDWYLFSDKGRQQMYEDLVKGENLQKYREHIDDRKDVGAYTRSLLDLHDGIAFIEKWKRNYGQDDLTVDAYGNYGLRRVTNESGLFMSSYDYDLRYKTNLKGPRDNLQGAGSREELLKQFKIEKKHLTENKWTMEYFAKQTKDLFRTQRQAADFSGYKALQKEKGLEQFYWRMYNPSTGYPPARSAVELEKQAKEIYKRSIPTVEKKFLSQKAISRYLMQELADRDYGANVWNYGFGEGKNSRTWSHITSPVPNPDYRGAFSQNQVFVNGKWTGLPSPFADSNETNTPGWLGVEGVQEKQESYRYMGMGMPYRSPFKVREGATAEKLALQKQIDDLTKLVQTKYKLAVIKPVKKVLVDTSGGKPTHPEMIPGEHPTKFFNRKGEEIIKTKTGKRVKHKNFTKVLNRGGGLKTIPEQNGTIINSNPGTIIHSTTGPSGTWTTHKHTEAEHAELMQYLWEQHGLSTVPQVGWLLTDEEQHVVLKNDRILHDKLNLPDYIRVVKEGNVLHEQLDPQLYHPRFAGDPPLQQHPLTQHTEPGQVDSLLQRHRTKIPKDYIKFLDEEEGSKEDLSYLEWEKIQQPFVTSQKPVGVSHPVMGNRPGQLGAQRTALKGK